MIARISIVLALGLLAGVAQGNETSQMILQTDFESDPAASGWVATPNQDVAPLWATGAGHSGRHYLEMSAGRWESPTFPVQPFRYYRASFWYQGTGVNHVAAFCYRADGSFIPADNYTSLAASGGWRRYAFLFRGGYRAATARVLFLSGYSGPAAKLLRVDDLQLEELSDAEALAEADALWAALPALTWQPPAHRFRRLPKMMAKLRGGQRVPIVMLGNSIINDTSNGPWDLFLERMYPGSRVELNVSVRGGTSCAYFCQPEHVKSYVLDYAPGVLWIGGASSPGDVEGMRSVIEQTRRAFPGVEVIISTQTCCAWGDPRGNPEWSPVIDPRGDNQRSQLWRLAQEEEAEFLDLSSGWGSYLRDQDRPYDFYMRDATHANDAGRMLLARIIEAYFRP